MSLGGRAQASMVHVNNLMQTGSLLGYGKQPDYTMRENVASGINWFQLFLSYTYYFVGNKVKFGCMYFLYLCMTLNFFYLIHQPIFAFIEMV